MTKIVKLFLSLAFLGFGIAACSSDNSGSSSQGNGNSTQPVPTDTPSAVKLFAAKNEASLCQEEIRAKKPGEKCKAACQANKISRPICQSIGFPGGYVWAPEDDGPCNLKDLNEELCREKCCKENLKTPICLELIQIEACKVPGREPHI